MSTPNELELDFKIISDDTKCVKYIGQVLSNVMNPKTREASKCLDRLKLHLKGITPILDEYIQNTGPMEPERKEVYHNIYPSHLINLVNQPQPMEREVIEGQAQEQPINNPSQAQEQPINNPIVIDDVEEPQDERLNVTELVEPMRVERCHFKSEELMRALRLPNPQNRFRCM